MSTLAEMKARIASEVWRAGDPEIAAAIAMEITSAIKFYRSKRFYFTEKDAVVLFDTVDGQSDYGAAAQANIPNLIRIDSISMSRDGHVSALRLLDELRMEAWLGSSSPLSGDPAWFSYYGQRLRFYPRPDGIYPIRIAGVIRIAAPATDDEADNAWMTDAEELIRSRAKRNVYANWMRDTEQAQMMKLQEDEAFNSLIVETSSRTQIDTLCSEQL